MIYHIIQPANKPWVVHQYYLLRAAIKAQEEYAKEGIPSILTTGKTS